MENYRVIIQHLRTLAGLSVQQAAKKISRSVGWLSESEFNRIVEGEYFIWETKLAVKTMSWLHRPIQ